MDPKQKLILIVCGAVCGLIVVALGALLAMQISAADVACATRDDVRNSLQSYYSEKIYPSAENRAVRMADAKAYDAWSDSVRSRLTAGLPVPEGESPSQFMDRLSRTIRKLNERQKNISPMFGRRLSTPESEGVQDYSFGRYVTQNELPAAEQVPRLSKQFAVIEYVSTLLLDSGVPRIHQVTRQAFDVAEVKPEEEERSSRRRSSRTSRSRSSRSREAEKTGDDAGTEVCAELKADGVTCESYAITFEARYSALVKVLNTLVAGDLFVVVKDLSIATPANLRERVDAKVRSRQDARAAEIRRMSRDKGTEEAQTKLQETPLFEGVSVPNRMVSDPANAVPLNVTLKFDVYSAPAAESADDADAEKEGK